MKKFWKKTEGFTLVELVVVIAILGILAGVGTVGYSGYVKKANMAADQQLVSQISNALQLAMYNEPFVNMPVGKLTLSTAGAKLYTSEKDGDDAAVSKEVLDWAGTEVGAALENAFGANYRDMLKLKYDGWKIAPHIQPLTSAEATLVNNSSYLSGERTDVLLYDVEKFTTMAHNLANGMGMVTGDTTLATLFGDDLLNKTAAKYNIKVADQYKIGDDVDWDKWHEDNPTEFSNMLVLATAVNMNEIMEGDGEGNGGEATTSTSMVMSFATYYGFAATCPAFSGVLTQYMDAMTASTATTINGVVVETVDSPADGKNWWNNLMAEAEKAQYVNAAGQTFDEYIASGNMNDQMSFVSIMNALSKTAAEDVSKDLNNSNLFTQGAVKDMYDQYVDAVKLMAGSEGFAMQVNDGEVVVMYNQNAFKVKSSIENG